MEADHVDLSLPQLPLTCGQMPLVLVLAQQLCMQKFHRPVPKDIESLSRSVLSNNIQIATTPGKPRRALQ